MEIEFVKDEASYTAALKEIDRLWGAEPGTEEGDRLDVLILMVGRYEDIHYPMPHSTPVEMIEFSMQQNGRTQADLAALLGSRSRASEILNGKRQLTLDQIRLLAREWHIPVACLVGDLEDA